MDKLIDYTGLETFHSNILDDNNTSTVSTWSSSKIVAELAALEARIAALENPNA